MKDKVQKIREEVERMHNLLPIMDGDNISVNYADRICTTLEMYIDSLQEEHVINDLKEASRNYADKEKFRKEIEKLKSSLIHGACSSQIAMETRCKEEAYNEVLALLDSSQEEPVSKDYRERYKRIAESEEFRKNYDGMSIGDIVPVEEQEPESEDLEKIVEEIAEPTILNAYGTKELARRLRATMCGTSVSEDLGEYINELSKQFPEVSFEKLSRIAVRVAKWQKEKFEKDYTDLCNGIATAKGIAVTMAYEKGVADTKVQMMKNIWKPADGDDLPIIDREVIVLIKYNTQRNIHDKEYSTYKVGFGHRPNPDGWDGKNIDTNEVTHYTPKLYDKGGWNAPDIVYWLDIELPKEIEL